MPNGSSSQIPIKQNEQEGYCVAAGIMSPFQKHNTDTNDLQSDLIKEYRYEYGKLIES